MYVIILIFGVSKFYNLKKILDNSISEQNRTEYYYKNGRNFFITEKGFKWFSDNCNNITFNNTYHQESDNSIDIYKNQIIDIYKNQIEEYKIRISYLETENKRLLDIVSVKEQKELAKDMKYIGNSGTISLWDKFINIFKRQ